MKGNSEDYDMNIINPDMIDRYISHKAEIFAINTFKVKQHIYNNTLQIIIINGYRLVMNLNFDVKKNKHVCLDNAFQKYRKILVNSNI